MLSDDDFYTAEINEMKNENPQLEEYDRIFRKMKEAFNIEIQSTRKQLFEKLQELNTKTENQFNQLYKTCSKHVRKIYDKKYNSKEIDPNSRQMINTSSDKIISNTDNIESYDMKIDGDPKKRSKTQNDKTNHIQAHKQQQTPILNNQEVNNNIKSDTNSDQDYSDDVVFGFLDESEDESDFLV